MAIEIINPEPDISVKKEIVCHTCGVRLSFTPFDVKRYDGKDISGGPDGQEWIDCPRCLHKVVIRSW